MKQKRKGTGGGGGIVGWPLPFSQELRVVGQGFAAFPGRVCVCVRGHRGATLDRLCVRGVLRGNALLCVWVWRGGLWGRAPPHVSPGLVGVGAVGWQGFTTPPNPLCVCGVGKRDKTLLCPLRVLLEVGEGPAQTLLEVWRDLAPLCEPPIFFSQR